MPLKLDRRAGLLALTALSATLFLACSSDPASPGGGAAGAAGSSAPPGGSTPGGSGGLSTGGAGAGGSAGSVSTTGGAGSGPGGTAAGGAGGSGGGTAGGTGGAAGATGGGGAGGAVGGSAGTAGGGAGGVNNAPFELKSSAFEEGDEIPLKYKCAEVNPVGQNLSPPLSWGPGPAGTKSYAIVLDHLPTPEHWVIWDIPATVTSLAEDVEHASAPAVPVGSKQSLANLDGFQGPGYLGPCPQAVGSRQTYRFTLYALDVETLPGLSATSSPGAAAAVVKQHLVAGSQGKTLSGTQIRTN